MKYLSYPTVKTTPNRKTRKSLRHSIGQKNRAMKGLLERAKRLDKKA